MDRILQQVAVLSNRPKSTPKCQYQLHQNRLHGLLLVIPVLISWNKTEDIPIKSSTHHNRVIGKSMDFFHLEGLTIKLTNNCTTTGSTEIEMPARFLPNILTSPLNMLS